jgi:hypothetical protein
VRAAVVDAVEGRCPTEIAVTRLVAAFIAGPAEIGPAERPTERNRRQNGEAIAQMAELERQGKSRQAASIVARRLAFDPLDPAEIWTLAQRFRRLRRVQK